ncbi:MAG: hypothetical protein GY866_15790 [Proteobacteria bacterium]|nr:hypothetical protein [Pseudomonadota bacterium]
MEMVQPAINERQILKVAKTIVGNNAEKRFQEVVIYPLLAEGNEGSVERWMSNLHRTTVRNSSFVCPMK